MPEFTYVARNNTGKRVTGSLSANNRREALAQLAGLSLFPVEVQTGARAVETKRVKRIPAQLLATMYSQLADLLHSGVPLLRALDVLRKQSSHAGLSSVLEEVHHYVEEGSTLADAMGRFPRVFGEMPVSMVRAGGEGGFLEEVLNRVAQFTETQEDLKQRTMGAMAYPMVLVVVLVTVVTALMVFLVPNFEGLFTQLRERNELPWATELVLGVSVAMRRYGPILAGGLGFLGFLIYRQFKSPGGQAWWDRVRLKLPLLGPIVLQLAVARFCRVLGTLLHNGVPILKALEISSSATSNRVLGAAIRQATENISAGQSLAAPLAACGHFPVTVTEMISVAEQANSLESVLLNIADSMERRTWRRLDIAVRLLEPLLLVVLAGIVLVIVVALLMPLLKMSSTL